MSFLFEWYICGSCSGPPLSTLLLSSSSSFQYRTRKPERLLGSLTKTRKLVSFTTQHTLSKGRFCTLLAATTKKYRQKSVFCLDGVTKKKKKTCNGNRYLLKINNTSTCLPNDSGGLNGVFHESSSHSVEHCMCCVPVCQSASGSGPQCGFNPTLPWPGSKDNEVPEVCTLQRRESRDITGWCVRSAERHMAAGGKKTTGCTHWERDTVFTDCWKPARNEYTLLWLIRGNTTGCERRAYLVF